jgi:hypothetical protein
MRHNSGRRLSGKFPANADWDKIRRKLLAD